MKVHYIPYKKTGYFSKIITDYLEEKKEIKSFYETFPSIENFEKQIQLKSSFSKSKRNILVSALKNQYKLLTKCDKTKRNIELLQHENTFTITTGHQLNLFTGPLYFLYKIISTINLTKELKDTYPKYNFVPIYWMATEDHDFDEINFFNFKKEVINWKTNAEGAVGRFPLENFETVIKEFKSLLNNSNNAKKLEQLFVESYTKHKNLTDATRFLANELFGNYGLVILDGDDADLKSLFKPQIKNELLHQNAFAEVIKTNKKLEALDYNIQVNPREINLFYLKNNSRERILKDKGKFLINNTNQSFTKLEMLAELEKNPERFSPNVIMRPLYQETILPNLCYIGGGGELAYWLQLKSYFNAENTVFPILLLRNSVLLISTKQLQKLNKLNVSLEEIFLPMDELLDKKVREISKIDIDFSPQKDYLKQQFKDLKVLAKQTDYSFLGAVNAQEAKQLKGLEKLEKRLLKAQKRKLKDELNRIEKLKNDLFPNQSLEERYRNFSHYYLDLGEDLLPALMANLNPLKQQFTIVEY